MITNRHEFANRFALVGYVTRLGYLFCIVCRPEAQPGDDEVRYLPHSEEACDGCHRRLDRDSKVTS